MASDPIVDHMMLMHTNFDDQNTTWAEVVESQMHDVQFVRSMHQRDHEDAVDYPDEPGEIVTPHYHCALGAILWPTS